MSAWAPHAKMVAPVLMVTMDTCVNVLMATVEHTARQVYFHNTIAVYLNGMNFLHFWAKHAKYVFYTSHYYNTGCSQLNISLNMSVDLRIHLLVTWKFYNHRNAFVLSSTRTNWKRQWAIELSSASLINGFRGINLQRPDGHHVMHKIWLFTPK